MDRIVIEQITRQTLTWRRPCLYPLQHQLEANFLQSRGLRLTRSRRSMSRGNKMVAEIIIVSSLFLVSASIRGLNLSTLAAGPDELTYLSRAVVILGDNWQWPKAFMTDQPPLFIYVLAIVVGTIGGSLETLRWVSVLA